MSSHVIKIHQGDLYVSAHPLGDEMSHCVPHTHSRVLVMRRLRVRRDNGWDTKNCAELDYRELLFPWEHHRLG